MDHLVAPVLAEVDVEVGHRHAVGVEEALEEEVEAERIEVGDGERPGDHRAGAGAAPRPDRDALPLGPLDEVGDDQEVARILHPDDDPELELEPGVVVLPGPPRREAKRREPAVETVLRRLPQELRLGLLGGRGVGVAAGKARQDRLP